MHHGEYYLSHLIIFKLSTSTFPIKLASWPPATWLCSIHHTTLSCLDSLCSFSTDTVVELRSMAFFWVLYIQTHRIEIVIFCVVVPWYSYLLGRWQPLPWQYRVKVNLLE